VSVIGHVYIEGPCSIGEGTTVFPFACIGFPGQDVKFKPGDPTAGVVIGKHGIIREHVTIHAATKPEAPTSVGDRVFMMVNSHVGHDGAVGDNVVMVNGAAIGGHARLMDNCTMGGGAMLHQFNRVGRFAFISGTAALSCDVPPFCIAEGRNRLAGINRIGLRRNGFSPADVSALRHAFRELFRNPVPREEMTRVLRERGQECPPLLEMAEFIAGVGKRSLAVGVGRPPRSLAAWLQSFRRGKATLDFADQELEEA